MTREEFVAWSVGDGKVTLHGRELVLYKRRGDTDGALATQDDYDNFRVGYGHAFASGTVMQLGKPIATLDDIKVVPK